jgi:hypothetical protein
MDSEILKQVGAPGWFGGVEYVDGKLKIEPPEWYEKLFAAGAITFAIAMLIRIFVDVVLSHSAEIANLLDHQPVALAATIGTALVECLFIISLSSKPLWQLLLAKEYVISGSGASALPRLDT